MSDGVFIQALCQLYYLWQSKLVYQRIVCMVFVNSPHYSDEDHMELDFPISLSMYNA